MSGLINHSVMSSEVAWHAVASCEGWGDIPQNYREVRHGIPRSEPDWHFRSEVQFMRRSLLKLHEQENSHPSC